MNLTENEEVILGTIHGLNSVLLFPLRAMESIPLRAPQSQGS